MKELINKFLKYLEVERNASTHTVTAYSTDLKQFLTFVASYFDLDEEDARVDQVDRLLIRLWLGELSDEGTRKKQHPPQSGVTAFIFSILF